MALTSANCLPFGAKRGSKGGRQRSLPLVGRVRVGVHLRKNPNAIALVSNPRSWNGRSRRNSVSTSLNSFCSRTSKGHAAGHYAYYGIGGNVRRLRWYARQVVRVWQKWLSRRDRQSVVRWARLNEILKRRPLAKIVHPYTAMSETLS
ncbi:hypothetical protein [Mesorhizobium sp. M0159]|uniref:hypothetical protein n=1 Tax=Mesorhizobium sp. M0159 TaxID=2956900 RepID=UPI00333B1F69